MLSLNTLRTWREWTRQRGRRRRRIDCRATPAASAPAAHCSRSESSAACVTTYTLSRNALAQPPLFILGANINMNLPSSAVAQVVRRGLSRPCSPKSRLRRCSQAGAGSRGLAVSPCRARSGAGPTQGRDRRPSDARCHRLILGGNSRLRRIKAGIFEGLHERWRPRGIGWPRMWSNPGRLYKEARPELGRGSRRNRGKKSWPRSARLD